MRGRLRSTPVLRVVLAAALAVTALAVVAAPRSTAAPTCTITWDGGAGTTSWHTAANWRPDRLPGPGDHVCIPASATVVHSSGTTTVLTIQAPGTLRLTGGELDLTSTADDSAAASMTQTGGILGGAGRLVVSGLYSWSGGTMTDPGTTEIAPGATLERTGSYVYLYDGRVLENDGTIVVATEQPMYQSGGTPLLRNNGDIRMTDSGTAELYVPVENDGSIQSTAGQLEMRGGDGPGLSNGDFGASTATTGVRFAAGDFDLGSGAQLLGGVTIAGGKVNVPSSARALGANGMSGGELIGTGTFTIAEGTFTWSGGYMRQAGTTRVAAGATLARTGSYVYLYDGRVLENSGTLDLRADQAMYQSGSTPLVRNLGLIRKTAGDGTAPFYLPVENDGRIESISGRVSLDGGDGAGTSSGSFGSAGSAHEVFLDGGTFDLAGGAELRGGATIAGAIVDAQGTLTSTGVNAMTGGELRGAGTFDIASGTFHWSFSGMRGPGRTRVAAGAVLATESYGYLYDGRVIENNGTIDVSTDQPIYESGTAGALIRNAGTLRKTAGASTATIYPAVVNTGTVRSDSGRLAVRGRPDDVQTGTFTGASDTARTLLDDGTFVMGSAARLTGFVELAGSDLQVPEGVTLAVPDRLIHTGGDLRGPGTLSVPDGGILTWQGGAQLGPGTTRIEPGGRLNVDATCVVYMQDGRRLENAGTLSLLRHSTLGAFGSARSTIQNTGDIVFEDGETDSCGGFRYGITGDVLVDNDGSLTKRGRTTTTGAVDGAIDNDGTVEVEAGFLTLTGDALQTQTGAFRATGAGSALIFEDGPFRLGEGASLSGDATVDFGARFEVLEGVTVDVAAGETLTVRGGTVGGTGTLRVAGDVAWESGEQADAGTTIIEAGGEMTVGGASFYGLELGADRALVNHGTFVVDAEYLYAEQGSSILNRGTLELRGETQMHGWGFWGFGEASLLHNTGVVRKTGAGTAVLQIVTDNDGTFEVEQDRLEMEGALLNYSETTRTLSSGRFVIRDSTLRLSGPVQANASTLELVGADANIVYPDPDTDADRQALGGLARNAGAGELVVRGGRALSTPAFLNLGVVRIGADSSLTSDGEYRQSSGVTRLEAPTASLTATGARVSVSGGRLEGTGTALPSIDATGGSVVAGTATPGVLNTNRYTAGGDATLRVPVTPGGQGRLAVTGAAGLGGTLDIVTQAGYRPTPGTTLQIATFGSRGGTFAGVNGTDLGDGLEWEVVYSGRDVGLVAVDTTRRAAPDERVAVSAAPPEPEDLAPAQVDSEPLSLMLDDGGFVAEGGWLARAARSQRDFRVTSKRGARLVRPRVSADSLALVARTCRRCGTVAVRFGGRLLRRVALRAPSRRWRTIPLATFAATRTGAVELRVVSKRRRVAVDGLRVTRP